MGFLGLVNSTIAFCLLGCSEGLAFDGEDVAVRIISSTVRSERLNEHLAHHRWLNHVAAVI